jgi:hypothetical protein
VNSAIVAANLKMPFKHYLHNSYSIIISILYTRKLKLREFELPEVARLVSGRDGVGF